MYLLNYIMLKIAMAMSYDIVNYISCKFYFLCKILVTTKTNKFI